MKLRVGNGFDVHRLVSGRDLILCGVKIDHEKGLLGHSDADVALHAVCDALLGAASLGDIGKHFPDNDIRFKDIDSRLLLRETGRLIEENGYCIENIDLTIIAERPKVAPFIPIMKKNLAEDLNIAECDVSVKATTTEHLGFTGREEGIAALASALLISSKK